jgi:hypothetical protein
MMGGGTLEAAATAAATTTTAAANTAAAAAAAAAAASAAASDPYHNSNALVPLEGASAAAAAAPASAGPRRFVRQQVPDEVLNDAALNAGARRDVCGVLALLFYALKAHLRPQNRAADILPLSNPKPTSHRRAAGQLQL